jgi:hypothetical protein
MDPHERPVVTDDNKVAMRAGSTGNNVRYGDCHVNDAPAERESKGSALVQAAVAARQF